MGGGMQEGVLASLSHQELAELVLPDSATGSGHTLQPMIINFLHQPLLWLLLGALRQGHEGPG